MNVCNDKIVIPMRFDTDTSQSHLYRIGIYKVEYAPLNEVDNFDSLQDIFNLKYYTIKRFLIGEKYNDIAIPAVRVVYNRHVFYIYYEYIHSLVFDKGSTDFFDCYEWTMLKFNLNLLINKMV